VESGPAWTHRKLRYSRETHRLPVYASHYRFGALTEAAPLLVYIGGAAAARTHIARASTEPVLLRNLIAAALAAHPLHALDALICPCPMDANSHGTEGFVRHLRDDLLPLLPRGPTSFGFVGYSAGAPHALRAAILMEARAIALLGGAGVEHALRAADLRQVLDRARSAGRWSCEVAIYRNKADDLVSAAELAELVPAPMRAIPCRAGPGGHEFKHYAANGSAASAFRLLVRALAR
jgi:hypothetical protein